MNQRIRELAEQTGSTHKQNLGVYQFYTDELEKFAELLLKQCLSYIDDSFGDVDYVKFMIKRDFGVEE